MNRQKEPLWRKQNTTVHNSHNPRGGQFSDDRHTKVMEERAESGRLPMQKIKDRRFQHRDYTPLFKFLLSRVGRPWEPTYKEARSRLDREDPIWWMVARTEEDKVWATFRAGESSYYSKLYVDAQGILQKVDPDFGPQKMRPSCYCCTHTLNGAPLLPVPEKDRLPFDKYYTTAASRPA